jgi:TPR repeat protein
MAFKNFRRLGRCCLVWCLLSFQLTQPARADTDPALIRELRAQAEQGAAEAQLALGLIYYSGEGVPQHLGEAVKWLRRAAEQGNAVAQASVGVLFLKGEGVPRNALEGYHWLSKAAHQGLASAQVQVGRCYLQGVGVRSFPQEAFRWFRRAAEQGDAQGQRQLGALYAEGNGVPRDLIEAYKWMNLAAAQGDEQAAEARRTISRILSQVQITEAQRRSLAFRARPEGASRQAARKSGSGFFVSTAGYIITCQHVIEGASRVTVRTRNGVLPAEVIKTDEANDLALLKVVGHFAALSLTNSQSVRLGDPVLTLGYPNIHVQGKELKLTRGEINSLAGMKDDTRYFQMSAAVQPGNSGGPLLDRFGTVVGVVTLRLDDLRVLWSTGAMPQNVNYSLKSSHLIDFLRGIPTVRNALAAPSPLVDADVATIVAQAQQAVVMVQGN